MRRDSRLSARKSSTPEMANVIASPSDSRLNTMGGSMPAGNEAMRSTAFLTSCKMSSVSLAFSTVTVMFPAFSLHTD